MYHLIQNEPCIQGNSFKAPMLISLGVNLVELRKTHPIAYLECFLALSKASGFDGDTFCLHIGELSLGFEPVNLRVELFLKPNEDMVTEFESNPLSSLRLESFSDPYTIDMVEPSLVEASTFASKRELELYLQNFNAVTLNIEKVIQCQINTILKKYNIGVA